MKKGETLEKVKAAYERTRKSYMKYAGKQIYTGTGKAYTKGGLDLTAFTLPSVKPITGKTWQKQAEEMKHETVMMRHYMKQYQRYERHLKPMMMRRNAWEQFDTRVRKNISDSVLDFTARYGKNPRMKGYLSRVQNQWNDIKEALREVSDIGKINGGKVIQEDAKTADDLESLFNDATFEYNPELYSDKYGRIKQFLDNLEKVSPTLAKLLQEFYNMKANWNYQEWSEEDV